MSSVVRSKVERSVWAVPLSFGLLVVRAMVALMRLPSGPELLYLADQAVRMGLAAAALMCALAWLDDKLRGERSWLTFAGLLALFAPTGLHAAHYFAHSDSLMRRSVPAQGSALLVLGFLAILTYTVWRYQRQRSPSVRMHGLAWAVLAVLVGIDATMGFSQSGLVPFCYGAAAVVLTVLLGSRLVHRPLAFRLSLGLTALVCCVHVAGLAMPAHAERARADLHRTESSLSHLDMFLTRSAGPSLLSALNATRSTRCDVKASNENTLGLTPEQRRNVVIISVDSVRVDDAFTTRRGRIVMPELKKFVDESWSAPAAYSSYPATLMSLSSALSGLLPSRLMLQSPAPPSIVGRALADTHARAVVLPAGQYFKRAAVEDYLLQGSERIVGANAVKQTTRALEKLEQFRAENKPHVLWVHYLEPHEPYVQHAEFGFGSSERDRYRSELAHVDRELGRLFAGLREGGWYDDSLIFVLADHGEAFGEHGQRFHHYQLYPWLTQVPFAMHVPGQKPRRFGGPVQLTDVAATTLEFVGQAPQTALDGLSLLSQPPRADRAILSEEFPARLWTLARYASAQPPGRAEAQRRAEELEESAGYPSKVSVIRNGFQLILHRATGVMELYDLTRDPGAHDNLAYRSEAQTKELKLALATWFEEIARTTGCAGSGLSASASREPRMSRE